MFPLPKGKPEFSKLEEVNFDSWNEEKKALQRREAPKTLFINMREIWYVKMGINVGNETNGKQNFLRPVLVLQKVGNMFFVLPLTTHGKDNVFHHTVQTAEYIDQRFMRDVSRVQLSQAKIVDKRRFEDRIGIISEEEFDTIKKKLTGLLL